jgi:hypothetical protein
MLLQDADDLLLGSYRSLHRPSLPWGGLQSLVEEISRGRSAREAADLLFEQSEARRTPAEASACNCKSECEA